jgi:hypothetical protein
LLKKLTFCLTQTVVFSLGKITNVCSDNYGFFPAIWWLLSGGKRDFSCRVLEKRLPILRKTTPRPSSGRCDYCFATSRRPAADVKMLRQSFGSCFPNSVMRFGSQQENFKNIQKKNIRDEWHPVPQT